MDYFAWLIICIVGGVSIASSIKVMKPDTEALVERLGQYQGTKLEPGVNFIFPILDRVVFQESLTKKIWDIPAQECITRDNVSINVDAVVSWRIVDIQQVYYKVENLQSAMVTLIQTQIRSEMGKLDLDQIFAHRIQINESLLHELNSATDFWGVKVIQVELRDIVVNA